MNAPATQSVSPSSLNSPQPRSWLSWKILAITMALAVLLIIAECVWLRGHQHARKVAWANARVEDQIGAARLRISEQRWDAAIRLLEDALDVEAATNRVEIGRILAEARRGQAASILEAAGIALAHRRTDDALRLLRAYLALPHAEHLERARLMREDIEHALSDDEAAHLLEGLSDEALTVFQEKGQLTEDDGLHTSATHAIFLDTLRRNVGKEVQKREARREVARLTEQRRAAEQARRIARLRATAAFHSLTAFLTRTQEQSRAQEQIAQRQEAELGELFQQLGVNDAAEQQKFRVDFLSTDEPPNIREQLEHKRAEVKRDYRDSVEALPADRELFDQLVDQEVDAFLKMLPPS
jgi:hypothetical protein